MTRCSNCAQRVAPRTELCPTCFVPVGSVRPGTASPSGHPRPPALRRRAGQGPLIGLDCDGVLYRWDEAVWDTLRALRGVERPEYAEDHWFAIRDAMLKDDWHWLWNAKEPRRRMFGSGRPYAEGVRAAWELERLGRVVIVTHRPADVMDVTMAWLAAQRIRPHGLLHFGHGDKKWEHELSCATYIDDSAENAVAIAAKGIPVHVPRRPWNREVHDGSDLILPFDDWSQPLDWIKENL